MNKIILALSVLLLSAQSYAGPKITDVRQGGFLYGFLTSIEDAQNAGDGVLIVAADISCTKHKSSDPTAVDSYYCMGEVGGITGDLAQLVYQSFKASTEEKQDDITIRSGTVACASIEESGQAPRFNCY